MPMEAENIRKRKYGRWEGRYRVGTKESGCKTTFQRIEKPTKKQRKKRVVKKG